MAEAARDFHDLQRRFAAHIRDPEHNPPPEGLEDRRLGIYRTLFYDNVEGLVRNSFPVLRGIIDEDRWHDMIRDFFRRHRSRTPLFPRIPQEFLQYLSAERDDPRDPPFLRELAHYEWLEVEVALDPRDTDAVDVDPAADVVSDVPVLNPVCRARAYRYPVHAIGPGCEPDAAPPEPTYLVVFRARDDEVRFMRLNPVAARLLELIMEDANRSGAELLARIAEELDHPEPRVVVRSGRETLQRLLERGVLIGARRKPH